MAFSAFLGYKFVLIFKAFQKTSRCYKTFKFVQNWSTDASMHKFCAFYYQLRKEKQMAMNIQFIFQDLILLENVENQTRKMRIIHLSAKVVQYGCTVLGCQPGSYTAAHIPCTYFFILEIISLFHELIGYYVRLCSRYHNTYS